MSHLVAGKARNGGKVRCYRTDRGGGGEERDMQSSSPKLDVLGVSQSDHDAFSTEVNTLSGEKMMGGCLVRRR